MTPPPPRFLYKYQTVTPQTLANLESRTLWFSAPERFNDPFDCALQLAKFSPTTIARFVEHARSRGTIDSAVAAALLPNGVPIDDLRTGLTESVYETFERMRQNQLRERGVACFSACVDDMLMWSHYANGHRGFCLEFATHAEPFSNADPIVYASEVPTLDPADMLADGPTPEIKAKFVLTKSECWKYEQEWRLFSVQANRAHGYDHRLLTGVYLGAAMPAEHIDVIRQLLLDAPTQLHRMELVPDRFRVEARPY